MQKSNGRENHQLFIQNITNIDSSIFDPIHGILGCSWTVDIAVMGFLDSNGFICDFSLLKKSVKSACQKTVDHVFLFPSNHEAINMIEIPGPDAKDDLVKIDFFAKSLENREERWSYTGPKSSVYSVPAKKIEISDLEKILELSIRKELPENVKNVSITLNEEKTNERTSIFRYTHGLTNHQGLCQRLFHGHRSKIEVFVDEKKDVEIEKYLIDELFGGNVHFASASQIDDSLFILHERSGRLAANIKLSYEATFGHYSASIPAHRVLVFEDSTSIENIANTLVQILKEKFEARLRNSQIEVRCCEGIGKGAVARR